MTQPAHNAQEATIVRTEDDDEIDLLALVRTVWRAKWLILFFASISTALGYYYVSEVATPTFVAETSVALESEQNQIIDLESIISGIGTDQSTMNTEVEVLRSRELIISLVEAMNLTTDPYFNGTLVEPSPYSIAGLRQSILGTPNATPLSDQQIRDRVVDRVLSSLSVSNLRQSFVFRIRFETDSPSKSAQMADTLAELYIAAQLTAKFDATESAIGFLTDRAARLQEDLEVAENAVKDFATNNDLVTRETLALKNRQLSELRERQAATLEQVENLQLRIARLETALSSSDPVAFLIDLDEPELIALARRIGTAGYGEDDFVSSLSNAIGQLRIELERERNQTAILDASAERLRVDIETESNNLLTFEQLQRETEANRLLYEYFLSRLKEAAVQQGIQQPDARILSRATMPRGQASPRTSMVLAMSFILGAMLGAAIALFRELANNSVRTAEELETVTGKVVSGQIPRAKLRRRKDLLDYLSKKPNSPFSEAIRNLRTSILLSNVDEPPKVIMLTSSVPNEGKTTIALSLSENLCKIGKKVLLIEADIRRRTFNQYFDVNVETSLVESVTAGGSGAIAVSDSMSVKGLDMVFGGKTAINAADFFSSDKFESYIERARAQYDYVIIDTPPVLVVPDARIIGRHSDAIVYCVHWDKTPKAQPVNGIRSLEGINLKVHSLILSQIDPAGMKRYGYGESYGGYAKGGSGYYDT